MESSEQKILQKHLAKFLVKDVFNLITEDEILKIRRSKVPLQADQWTFKGQPLPQAQVQMLQQQAETLKNSELWRILKTELLYHAQKKGLYDSQTTEDILSTKVMLYLIDVIDSKLNSMSQ